MDEKYKRKLDIFWDALEQPDFEQLSTLAPEIFVKTEGEPDDEITETLGEFAYHYLDLLTEYRKFQQLQDFKELLKQEKPFLDLNCMIEINSNLIHFHAYQGSGTHEIRPLFNDIWTGKEHIDLVVLEDLIFSLMYYGYGELIGEVMVDAFQTFAVWKNRVSRKVPLLDTARMLDAHYTDHDSITEEELQNILDGIYKRYKLSLNDTILQELKLAHLNRELNSREYFEQQFDKSPSEAYAYMQYDAQIYLFERGIPFYVSETILYHLYPYFFEYKKDDSLPFFFIESKSIADFVPGELSRKDQAMVIWGLPYLIGYWTEKGYVEIYRKKLQLETVEKLKKAFIHFCRFSLWQFSFVHHWQPEVDHKEKQVFDRSFECTEEEIFQGAIGEQSLGIGQDPYEMVKTTRLSTGKFKRNDKISVKYYDGKVKSNIKYKHVMHDIESGKCDIIET